VNYQHIGGHVIVVPEEVSTMYRVLPPKLKSLTDTMKVIWVGKDQPKYMDLKPYLEVRREVVRQTLFGLKRDNPVYRDVEVDEASGAVGAKLAYLISKSIKNSQANRKLQEQEQEEPEQYIRYVHSRQPLNDYNDPEYFLGSFPTLFWNGRGGHMEERKLKVSFRKWVEYLLNHHSRRFARHPWFMFLAFNIHVRRLSAGRASLIANRKSWPKIRENLASLTSRNLELAAAEMRNGQKVSNK